MTANANVVDLVKGNSTLVRPKFSPGLLLRDDDLNVGVDYTRELSRLLFQSLFGCGVVCGLTVTTSVQCGKLLVTVDAGVALNGAGDPIHVPEKTTLTVDPTCGKAIPDTLWVLLCRTEKCCAPRSAVCGCDDDSASVCTREQEWFEIRLVTDPGECACRCDSKTLDPRKLKKASEKAAAQPAAGARAAEIRSAAAAPPQPGCACVDPCDPCYQDHYAGKCSCDCCSGDCVVLALLTASDKPQRQPVGNNGDTMAARVVNHSVRRFIRPVLMRDPVAWVEQNGQPLCRDANPKLTVRKNK